MAVERAYTYTKQSYTKLFTKCQKSVKLEKMKPQTRDMNVNEKPYLTTRQAATMLDVSQRTVQVWVEKGQLEAWKTVGGHRRISKASVSRLIQAQNGYSGEDSGLNLLIVEDQSSQLVLYRKFLEKSGLPLNIHTAADGFRGLVKIGQIKPDIVLTDLIMPGMDGFKMLEAIRKVEELKSLPIIVITGLEPDAVLEGGLDDEAVTVLHKPLEYAALKKAVEENCGKLPLGKTQLIPV